MGKDQGITSSATASAAAPSTPTTPAVPTAVPLLARDLARVIGTRTAKKLAKLDLHTAGDLLRHYPFRYAHRGQLTDINSLIEGEEATVIATVHSANLRPMRNRRGAMLSVLLSDNLPDAAAAHPGARQSAARSTAASAAPAAGSVGLARPRQSAALLSLTFFAKHANVLRYHESRLVPGALGMFSGTVSSYRDNLQLTHPDYQLFDDPEGQFAAIESIDHPLPVYRTTAGLPTWVIAAAVGTVLDQLTEADLPDPLPEEFRSAHQLPDLKTAFELVHRPATDADCRRGRTRFKYQEALITQVTLAQRRHAAQSEQTTARPRAASSDKKSTLAAFDRSLPFELTAGQRKVGEEIAADLASTTPMQRLLQGDVGSGKTIVGLRAMLQVADCGGQSALIAPTEVLAYQHYRSICDLLGPLGRRDMLGGVEGARKVVLLTGSAKTAERRQALADIASGDADIIIGTHALLSEVVQPADLGLVIIDEQHRFGVEQRDTLRARTGAHLLVMTATPIPRTIAMTVFGDLEVSELTELPAGRAEVSTVIVPTTRPRWVDRTWQRAREEVDSGGRVFVVVPRIDESDDDAAPAPATRVAEAAGTGEPGARGATGVASVAKVAGELRAMDIFDSIGIGELHGRMSAAEKDRIMADFISGACPILVSTTVIEVGVDVPDATAMIIMEADRFGLSPLHQLRGRIGRGTRPGVCLAMTASGEHTLAMERLRAFASTRDGFALARTDVELRREGDVLGTVQAGRRSSLKMLSVITDGKIIGQAQRAARELIGADPTLADHPHLARAVAEEIAEEQAENLEKV